MRRLSCVWFIAFALPIVMNRMDKNNECNSLDNILKTGVDIQYRIFLFAERKKIARCELPKYTV